MSRRFWVHFAGDEGRVLMEEDQTWLIDTAGVLRLYNAKGELTQAFSPMTWTTVYYDTEVG